MKIFVIPYLAIFYAAGCAAGDVVYVASDCPLEKRYLNDRGFIEKIARENGLISMRFYSQETTLQISMIAGYAKKNRLCQNSTN